MCSVIEIKNNDEYNIFYQSPETLEKAKKDSSDKVSLVNAFDDDKDYSLEEFGSYNFIKELSGEENFNKQEVGQTAAETNSEQGENKEQFQSEKGKVLQFCSSLNYLSNLL